MKKVVFAIALAAIGFAGAMVFRHTGNNRAERAVSVAAPPAVVLAVISDLRRWPEWWPRERLEGQVQRSYGGPATGVGASSYWSAGDAVGRGRMTITDASDGKIMVELELTGPRPAESDLEFRVAAEGGGSRVSVSVAGDRDLEGRRLGLFSSAEKRMGPALAAILAAIQEAAEQDAKLESSAVERSAIIAAPPDKVLEQLADLRRWQSWSPWGDADPAVQRAYGGPPSGAGASCYWWNDDVRGRITVVEIGASHLDVEVETVKPSPSLTDLHFAVAAEGARTRLTARAKGGPAGASLEKALAQLTATVEPEASQAGRIAAGSSRGGR
ncbi:MAG TPA: SRPBCC family protein [Gemmatimonadales bacterium]